MINNIKELKGSYSYLKDIDVIYGIKDTYYFSVQKLERANMICIVLSVNHNEQILKELDKLRGSLPAIPFGGVYAEGTEVNVELNMLNIASVDTFNTILECIVNVLQNHDAINVCSQTRQTTDLGLYRVGTKVKVLGESVFESQIKNNKGIKTPRKTNRLLGYGAVLGIFILMVLVKHIVGSLIFIIPLAITVGAFRLAVETYEKVGGMIYKKDAIAIVAIFVGVLIIAPILQMTYQIMLIGFGFVGSFLLAIRAAFSSLAVFAEMYQYVPLQLAISILISWSHIQNLLNGAIGGNRIKRKNNRLM